MVNIYRALDFVNTMVDKVNMDQTKIEAIGNRIFEEPLTKLTKSD